MLSAAVLFAAAVVAAATHQLQSVPSISGRVLDDEGHAVPDAVVTVRSESSDSVRDLRTDGDGRFSANGVRPDWYHIGASKPGYISLEFGATDPSETGRPIVVAADSAVTDLIVNIPRAGSVSGTVVKPDGTFAAGSDIQVLQDRITPDGLKTIIFVARTTVNIRGTYRVDDVPPGRYVVAVVPTESGSRDGLSYVTTYYPASSAEGTAERIVIGPGQSRSDVNLQVQMAPVTSVRGQVRVATGHAISLRGSDFQLQLKRSDRTITLVRVAVESANNTFTLRDVPAGDYMLSVRSTDAAGEPVSGWLFDTIGGGGMRDVTLTMAPAITVGGRLLLPGPEATISPRPSRITLVPFDETSQGVATTAAVASDGSFLIPNVKPARYRVLVAFAPSVPTWRRRWAVESVTAGGVDVANDGLAVGGNVTDLTIAMGDHLGRVAGILSGDRSLVARATIIAFPTDISLWPSLGRRIIATRPAQDGQFEIRSLPAGDYRLAVLTDVRSNEWLLPETLRAAVPGSISVRVSDGTTTVKNIQARQ